MYIYDLCNNTMTYSFSGGKIHIKRLRGPGPRNFKNAKENLDMYEMIEADNAWDMSQARMLYEAAVPDMEKKPFRLFIDKRMLNKLEVKVFKDEKGLFAGFVIALVYADILLVDYFEISPDYADKGVETEALAKMKEILPGARMVFVCSESAEKLASFYESEGYVKADYRLGLGDIKQDVYVSADAGENVTFEELAKVYENIYGAMISGAVTKA